MRRRRFVMPGAGVVLAAALVVGQALPSQAITQTATLTASDPSAGNRFGTSVAISEDGLTALVGNQLKPSAPSTAYVFTKSGSTWTQSTMLAASDGVTNDTFGAYVALSANGTVAAVSAPNKTMNGVNGAGAVYIFTQSGGTWTQTGELTPASPTAYESYGQSLALSDDGSVLVVGAATYGSPATGAAFFYKNTAGTWTQRMQVAGNSTNALYGFSVAVSGNATVAAVGQPYYQYVSGGYTYYYPNTITYTSSNGGTSWSAQKVISSPLGAKRFGGDDFGMAVSLSNAGTTLVIGARSTSTLNGGSVAGAAYAYAYASGAWSTNPAALTLTASANHRLGQAVSLAPDGNSVVVGMPYGTEAGAAGGGAALQYTRSGNTWTRGTAYSSISSRVNNGDYFGATVALDAGVGHPLIGALGVISNGNTYVGAAYTY